MGGFINKVKLSNVNFSLLAAANQNNPNNGISMPFFKNNTMHVSNIKNNTTIEILPNITVNDFGFGYEIGANYIIEPSLSGCSNILYVESISASGGKTLYPSSCCRTFSGWNSLIGIGRFNVNTCKVYDFNDMFSSCYNLKKCPPLDCSSGGEFFGMFYKCDGLETIEKLIFNSTKSSRISSMFSYDSCPNLINVTIEGTIKVDKNSYLLGNCPNLTVDSLMSFINSFEDNTGEETQYTVTIGATNLAKLTPEQVAVATSKNILLA